MSLFIPSAIYLFVKNRKIFPSLIAISKLYALNCTWTDSKRHFNVYFSAPRSKHVYLDGANYQKWLTIAIALAHGWNPESLCKYAPLPTQVAATSLVLHLFSYSLAHTLLQKWYYYYIILDTHTPSSANNPTEGPTCRTEFMPTTPGGSWTKKAWCRALQLPAVRLSKPVSQPNVWLQSWRVSGDGERTLNY